MSDRKIDMTELANYIRIRPPEKEKLAELLIRAKAAVCGSLLLIAE